MSRILNHPFSVGGLEVYSLEQVTKGQESNFLTPINSLLVSAN